VPVKTLLRQVDGERRAPAEGTTFDVVDASDVREVVAHVPAMSAAGITELDDAVFHGARRWPDTWPIERGQVHAADGALLRQRREEIVDGRRAGRAVRVQIEVAVRTPSAS
jgi:acyl-CoA reductase-like NAD-dependent aldehyde dehydrogenase